MDSLDTGVDSPESIPACSQPLHVKRLEQALDTQILINEYGSIDSTDSDVTMDEDSQELSNDDTLKRNVLIKGNQTAFVF